MADNENSILDEFAAFMQAKSDADKEANAANDDEIEVWNSDGSGVRAKQSKFKPSFLESLGFGSDPEPETKDEPKDKPKPSGPKRQSTGQQAVSTARKYFAK